LKPFWQGQHETFPKFDGLASKYGLNRRKLAKSKIQKLVQAYMHRSLLVLLKQDVGLADNQLLDLLQKLRAILNHILRELKTVMALLQRTQHTSRDFKTKPVY